MSDSERLQRETLERLSRLTAQSGSVVKPKPQGISESTIAIIAGSIYAEWMSRDPGDDVSRRGMWRLWAVEHARAIAAEVQRTRPTEDA